MDLLVIGDSHGEVPELGDVEPAEFDVILCVGDVCGTPDELREAGIEARGTDKEWYEILGEERAKEIPEESLEQGRKVLEWLNSLGAPVLIVPGNADWTGELTDWEELEGNKYQEMVAEYDNVTDLNFRREELDGYLFIGYGPCPGPEKEPVLSENVERLGELFEKASGEVIFLSHNVPHNTPLDETEQGEHYGSKVVRQIVEDYQPVLSVAGHMHESQGNHEIGNTLCINTGLDTCVEIEIEDGEVNLSLN